MKTMKLTLVAMGLMAGLLNAGSAMAQGSYYYEDGYGGGGGMVVSSGCGKPNCRNPNCGGGGGGYGGGWMSGGGAVMPIGGTYREDGRVVEGGFSRRVPGDGGGRPMSGGAEWRVQEDRRVQERMGVRFQDPEMAALGGVLGGIGNALNKNKAKNGAAGDILNGIGAGLMLGAQPELRYDRREEYRQQGNIIIW
jgi:hypothetical protein